MPDAFPLTGLYGKVPAHGDFVRRGLPTSFVGPWDAWLQDGMATARERLGDRWVAAWDAAPPWRFALPAGACGPDAVAGVLLTSEDMVGRRFPITLAALLPPGAAMPTPAWFAALEMAARAGRAGRLDADGLAASIPAPGAMLPDAPAAWAALDPPPDPAGVLGLFAEPVPDGGSEEAADRIAPDAPLEDAGIGLPDGSIPSGGMATAGDDVLALLGLAAADEPPAMLGGGSQALPAAASEDDVLGLLTGAATSMAPGEPIPVADSDGTLAFLLGEAGGASEDAAALLPGGASEPQDSNPADPLTALIALGEPSPGAASAEAEAALAPPIPDDIALMPAVTPAPPPVPAEAPPAPPGGGWWTGGGGSLPPAVRPVAALLPPGDFASLLEADA